MRWRSVSRVWRHFLVSDVFRGAVHEQVMDFINTFIRLGYSLIGMFIHPCIYATIPSQSIIPPFYSPRLKHIKFTDKLNAGYQVLTAANTKLTVLWNVAPCILIEIYRRSRGSHFLIVLITGAVEPGKRLETSTRPREAASQKTVIFGLTEMCADRCFVYPCATSPLPIAGASYEIHVRSPL